MGIIARNVERCKRGAGLETCFCGAGASPRPTCLTWQGFSTSHGGSKPPPYVTTGKGFAIPLPLPLGEVDSTGGRRRRGRRGLAGSTPSCPIEQPSPPVSPSQSRLRRASSPKGGARKTPQGLLDKKPRGVVYCRQQRMLANGQPPKNGFILNKPSGGSQAVYFFLP